MRKRLLAGLVAISVVGSPAVAKQDFASYDGPNAVQTGTGGTKIAKNDIDYWTSGTPPRRYQVLGVLTDKRKDRAFDGSVIGSPSVAKIAKEAGGDAVIIGSADSSVVGVATNFGASAYGNNAFGYAHRRVINRTTTQIVVIKYLAQ